MTQGAPSCFANWRHHDCGGTSGTICKEAHRFRRTWSVIRDLTSDADIFERRRNRHSSSTDFIVPWYPFCRGGIGGSQVPWCARCECCGRGQGVTGRGRQRINGDRHRSTVAKCVEESPDLGALTFVRRTEAPTDSSPRTRPDGRTLEIIEPTSPPSA